MCVCARACVRACVRAGGGECEENIVGSEWKRTYAHEFSDKVNEQMNTTHTKMCMSCHTLTPSPLAQRTAVWRREYPLSREHTARSDVPETENILCMLR